jgi:hypothetical protein
MRQSSTATLRNSTGSAPPAAQRAVSAVETAWREPSAPAPCPPVARWAPAQTIAVALVSSGALWAGGLWLFRALVG